MASILTNSSALSALDTLRGLDRDLTSTQSRISSGLRVEKSADNAAYWSITTTMRSDDKAMSAVQDALNLGAAAVDVAYMGMNQAIDVMTRFQTKLVAAREPGVDRSKINSDLVQLRAQMQTIAEGTSFNGENWLLTKDGALEPSREIVSSFTRDADGSVHVGTIQWDQGTFSDPNRLIDDTSPGMYGILTQPGAASGWHVGIPNFVFMTGANPWPFAREMAVDDTTTNQDIDFMIDGTEYMHKQMINAAARLGAIASQIDQQSSYLQDLRDAANRGIGKLRDADMTNESSRLKALQVQQQLGMQALSIANSNADNVMSLFR